MSSSSRTLAAGERAALADLFTEVGPDAPTCCEGWTTAHLAAHLVVRERRPDALPGYGFETVGLPALAAWSHRLEDRARTGRSYAEQVALFRAGPPPWSLMALPGGGGLNTVEFVIHHEDVRRAQPGWAPRVLSREAQDEVWGAVSVYGRGAAGRPGGLILRRTDTPGVEKKFGEGKTVVEGEPLELLLWASGRRDVARITTS
jgi:uncharacterized protein (TIGR03085 family)